MEILEDKTLMLEESPGSGWAPIHAAGLLGELRAPEAVAPMLRVLAASHWQELLHDQVIQALPKIGAAVVEPMLRAFADSEDRVFRESVASVLARSGVRDDRIFDVLLETLRTSSSHGAGDLAEYGDARAIPHLSRAFDDYEIVVSDSPFANQDLVELRAAIEELGGSLSPAQDEKYLQAREPAERWRRQMRAALESRVPTPVRRRERPGRNDPCWCGGAKKYKKCHLATDEGEAFAGGAHA